MAKSVRSCTSRGNLAFLSRTALLNEFSCQLHLGGPEVEEVEDRDAAAQALHPKNGERAAQAGKRAQRQRTADGDVVADRGAARKP